MDYGPRAMVPAPGRESDIARLSTHWPLGGRLPALVQRARAAVQRDDPSIEAKPFSSAPALARSPIRNATLIWSRSSLTPSTTTSKTACICWPRWWPDQSRRRGRGHDHGAARHRG